ncbi:hypothetical protein [Leuconostoc gelidum]|uniref:Uncharacterized protein n=1 Tax=Leuconostoc gelidum subsp. gelidum TaxID=1607839 RepID=A0AB35FX03_LEUGE|nr:hypothetical protein [Leuconostoc gelidum]MBZ6001438.1 hypothetical protein [Leuconostoc gelidum subsp. gelidum]MBZ6015068.1 hypothetical protein [Leuconostoc gelidum subsp. gelidum]GMA68401.1 hypothetical protein GCM10025884_20280 [Leuconostoc gelidum subsp. gelidum]
MNEANKQKQRNRHTRDATDINRQHANNIKHENVARHARARVQIKSEVLENRQIDYSGHMMWLRRF